jgi:hypothetical protein
VMKRGRWEEQKPLPELTRQQPADGGALVRVELLLPASWSVELPVSPDGWDGSRWPWWRVGGEVSA